MSKQKFNPLALDQILNDAIADTADLQNELMTDNYNIDDESIIPAPAVSPAINNLLGNTGNGRTSRL